MRNQHHTAIDISSSVRRLSMSRVRIRAAALAALRAERVRDAMISVTFLGRAAMSNLNKRYLGHLGATDVISFGFGKARAGGAVIGDIYICPEIARANARREGVPAGDELLRLVVHGTLHVLGHEHPEKGDRSRSAMWRRQEKILANVL